MSSRHYRAFISYSRKDEAVARWLHSALERYRLPGKSVIPGLSGRPLSPIFLDRSELRTSSDLGASIAEGLEGSEYLIVLCSPAAVASRWVVAEIQKFLEYQTIERVIAVIVEGEPWPDKAGLPRNLECFPDILKFSTGGVPADLQAPREILAADLRPHGDGKRVVVAKIAATILDVDLDVLLRRDAQRTLRLALMVTAGAVVGALAMAFLAIQAYRATEQANSALEFAERKRVAAEGLVEFMLVDLRQKLEPVGRLDVLDVVSDRALEYYDGQDLASLDASALGRRARAMLLLGEVQDLQGNSQYALEVFERAASTTRQLLGRDEANPELIYNHAQSVFWVGYIAYNRGDYDNAEERFRQYYDLASRLVALDPDDKDWALEKMWALSNLGSLDFRRREYASAQSYFLEALDIISAEVRKAPTDTGLKRELAAMLSWASSASLQQLRIGEAGNYNQQELDVYQKILVEEPENREIQSLLLQTMRVKARLELASGKVDEARASLERAAAMVNALLIHEPDSVVTAELAGKVQRDLAEVLQQLRHGDAYVDAYNACIRLVGDPVPGDPNVAVWQVEVLVECRNLEARSFIAARALPVALEFLEQTLGILDTFRELGRSDPIFDIVRGETLLLTGEVYLLQGRGDSAGRYWQHARQALGEESLDTQPRRMVLLAHVMVRLGEYQTVDAVIDNLRAAGYRHPAFFELVSLADGQER